MTAVSEVTKTCDKHGTFTAKSISLGGREMIRAVCPTCADEKEQRDKARKQAELDSKRQAMIEHMTIAANIPPRFKSCTLDNYEADNEGQERALKRIRWFCETWEERKWVGSGLIFSGQPGTGKTHLAVSIAHHVIREGTTALFSTVGDAMRSIRRTYDDRSSSEGEAINRFVTPGLLILDEIGAALGSEHEKVMLFEIINKRYEHVKSTILMSNLSVDELKTFLGERIMDRMRQGGGKLITFDWASYRK